MTIQQDIPLKDYSTMRLGGTAKYLTEVTTKEELVHALEWAAARDVVILIIGGGSNIIFTDGIDGLVIVNRIKHFEVKNEDETSTTITIGAGELWDEVVARTVDMGLTGIEMLSAIPGTTGATPVQNVGAYGAEIADTLTEVEAYDMVDGRYVTLSNDDCKFAYRDSIFKRPGERRFAITSITLQLKKANPRPPFYASLQRYLDENGITEYTPQSIRQAVMAIRAVKLPDPATIANTGSFFKNPIVERSVYDRLIAEFPEMPTYEMPDGRVKLLAGWLIDQAGLRGYSNHGMKVYEQNALVFVNEAAESYDDLAKFKQEVIQQVDQKFGILLEQEPELL